MKNGLIRAFIALRFGERSVSHLVSARERLLDAAHVRAVSQHALAQLQQRMEHQIRILHAHTSLQMLFGLLVYHAPAAGASIAALTFILFCGSIF